VDACGNLICHETCLLVEGKSLLEHSVASIPSYLLSSIKSDLSDVRLE
jgi:hypothetical protein